MSNSGGLQRTSWSDKLEVPSKKIAVKTRRYRTLTEGHTPTLKDSPCWCTSGSPFGEGSP